jgi:hypothetical protein
MTATDMSVASLRVTMGQYSSKEEVLLQVAVLSMLASDLVEGEGKKEEEDFEDEMEYDEEEEGELNMEEYGGEINN